MDRWLTPRQVSEKVIALVQRARREYDLPVGTNAPEICSCLGLRIERGPLASGIDGLLAGRQILLNEQITWPSRVAFTILHEVMHHLLDEDGELIEYFTATLRDDEAAYKAAIEQCCNAGAAEFLIPRERVRELIGRDGLSVRLIGQLAQDSGASVVAAALQLALCAPQDCYVTLATSGPIPRSAPARVGLYLEYAFASWGIRYPLARFTSVPADHLLATAWAEQVPRQGPTFIPFRSGKRMPCYAEVAPIGSRVAGLLLLQRPVPAGQMALPL